MMPKQAILSKKQRWSKNNMNEVVISSLKEQPIIIPKVLFQNYKKLNITEEELVLLICIINKGDKIIYNPSFFTEEIGLDKYKAMQLLNDLAEKGIIEVKVENDKSGKKEEYIYLDFLYNKLFNLLLDMQLGSNQTINSNIFATFEQELGRTISPMEVQIIKEWLNDGMSEDLIKEALKEAIINNVRNLKYVDRILFNWRSKGFKTKEDVIKDKKRNRTTPKKTEPIYDYNWLEDE
jgi:DNA replication protein